MIYGFVALRQISHHESLYCIRYQKHFALQYLKVRVLNLEKPCLCVELLRYQSSLIQFVSPLHFHPLILYVPLLPVLPLFPLFLLYPYSLGKPYFSDQKSYYYRQTKDYVDPYQLKNLLHFQLRRAISKKENLQVEFMIFDYHCYSFNQLSKVQLVFLGFLDQILVYFHCLSL